MEYQIQPSNVVELQQRSPFSNNTSVTTYVHRLIISPPCLFKHTKNDERVLCFSDSFWIIHNKNSFLCFISFLRSIWDTLHMGFIYEGHWNENRTPAIEHIPRKSWQHCCYVSILLSVGQKTCIVKTHRSTQLFLYCSGGERSVKCVCPALEMEASKEQQTGVVRFLVAEGAAKCHKVKTPWNSVGRNHPFAW